MLPTVTIIRNIYITLLLGIFPLAVRSQQPQSEATSQPKSVTYCELAKDPAAYNKNLLRLNGFVTHGFEDFGFVDPDCGSLPQHFSIWLMYGGRVESDTVYCCPGEGGGGTRSHPLQVEGIQIPLIADEKLQQFFDLLKREPDTTVRVTLVGRFISGEKQDINDGSYWRGYGHLGCCSLFVIQKVEAIEPHTRKDLDYTAEAGYYEDTGCRTKVGGTFRTLRYISLQEPVSTTEAIREQTLADDGARNWAFNDTKRVALESMNPLYGGPVPEVHLVKKTSARQVFRARTGTKCLSIVVARPYWLSFYAKSEPVVWVVTAVNQSDR